VQKCRVNVSAFAQWPGNVAALLTLDCAVPVLHGIGIGDGDGDGCSCCGVETWVCGEVSTAGR
jgi:hypothetical protein